MEILMIIGIVGLLLLSFLGYQNFVNEVKIIDNLNTSIENISDNSDMADIRRSSNDYRNRALFPVEWTVFNYLFDYEEFVKRISVHFDATVHQKKEYQENETVTSKEIVLEIIRKGFENNPLYLEVKLIKPEEDRLFNKENVNWLVYSFSLYYRQEDNIKKEMLETELKFAQVLELPTAKIVKIGYYGSESQIIKMSDIVFYNVNKSIIDDYSKQIEDGNLRLLITGTNQVGKSSLLKYLCAQSFPHPTFEVDVTLFGDKKDGYTQRIEKAIKDNCKPGSVITISLGQPIFKDISSSQLTHLTEWMSGSSLLEEYKVNFIAASHEDINDIPDAIKARLVQNLELKKLNLEQFLQYLGVNRPDTKYNIDLNRIQEDAAQGFTYSDSAKYCRLK